MATKDINNHDNAQVIKVNIDLYQFKDDFAEYSDIGQTNPESLQEELKKRFSGIAANFNAVIKNSNAELEWIIPKSPEEAEKLNIRALQLAKRKSFEEAIALWKNAINLSPGNPEYHHNLGLAYLELKDLSKALDRFLEVIRICPIYFKAYFILGSIYSKLRQFNEAEKYLKLGLKFQPDHVLSLVNLGAVLSILRRYDEATRAFERAIALSPKEIRAYLGLGKLYAAQGDIDNANRCFKAVIKLDPQGKLGSIARRSLQTVDLSQDDIELTEEDKENVDELYLQGYQYFIHGDYENAVRYYKKYLKLKESDAEVWASLASCQLRLGKSQEAIASIRKALMLNPTKAAFYKQAAIIYDALGMDADIEKSAQKAIELGKRDSVTLALLGKSYVVKGEYQEGLNKLNEAIKQNPNNLKAHYYYAQGLRRVGKIDLARQHLEEILWAKIDSPLKEKARQELSQIG